jgi:hypothetical protein
MEIKRTLQILKDKCTMGAALCDQLHTEDDDSLDLAWWATSNLTPTVSYPELLDGLITASQPSVRYGCALILDAYYTANPLRALERPDILSLGYYDRFYAVSMIYRTLIHKIIKLTPDQLVQRAGVSPPIDLVERVATSLDYMTVTDKKKSLQFLDLWIGKIPFNQLILQSLLSLLPHANFRHQVIQIIGKLVSTPQAVKEISLTQIQLLWENTKRLPGVPNTLFPLFHAMKDFYPSLFYRIWHGDPSTRISVYSYLKTLVTGKVKDDRTWAITILIFSLGDGDVEALTAACDALEVFYSSMSSILQPLVSSASQYTSASWIHRTNLWETIATHISEHKLLSEWHTGPSAEIRDGIYDAIWDYYLHATADHGMAPSPDDLTYQRYFTHSPCWIGMLLYRMKIYPPALPTTEKRTTVPNLGTLKRRYYGGYLLTMFPMTGYPDHIARVQACTMIVNSCFTQTLVVNTTLKSILEYILQTMLTHKIWSYVSSGLDMATMILRIKIPTVSQYLVNTLLSNALDWAVNNPFLPIRISALHFLETACLVFPTGMNSRLAEIRDAARQCCVDDDPGVVSEARVLWTVVFRILSDSNASEFLDYIRQELNVLRTTIPNTAAMVSSRDRRSPTGDSQMSLNSSPSFFLTGSLDKLSTPGPGSTSELGVVEQIRNPHLEGDPLLQNLSLEQRKRLIRLLLDALGNIRFPGLADSIVKMTLGLVYHGSPSIRAQALKTVLHQFPLLKEPERHMLGWLCLPMIADTSPIVATVIDAHVKGILWATPDHLLEQSSAHQDDSIALISPLFEEMFTESNVYTVAIQNRIDAEAILVPLEYPMVDVPYSERLNGISNYVESMTGWINEASLPQILYYLERGLENSAIFASGLRTLAELSCVHDSCLEHVIDVLLQYVHDRHVDAMHALKRISEHSTSSFRMIIQEIMNQLNQSMEYPIGLLECCHFLHSFIREICPDKIDSIMEILIPALSSSRHGSEVKTIVASLIVDLIDAARVPMLLDAFHDMLNKGEAKDTVYALVRKLIDQKLCSPDLRHPIFSTMETRMDSLLMEGGESERVEAADVVSCAIFETANVAVAKAILLADENPTVANKARDLFLKTSDPEQQPVTLVEYLKNTSHSGENISSKVITKLFDVIKNSRPRTLTAPHAFSVLKVVFDAVQDRSNVIEELHRNLETCTNNSHRIRTSLISELDASAFFLDEFTELPLAAFELNVAQPARNRLGLAASPTVAQTMAMLGLAKGTIAADSTTGSSESVDIYEKKKQTLSQVIAERQGELDFWVHGQIQTLLILSRCRGDEKLDNVLVEKQLEDDHRGVRAAAAYALSKVPFSKDQERELFEKTIATLAQDRAIEDGGGYDLSLLDEKNPSKPLPLDCPGQLHYRKTTFLKLLVGLAKKMKSPTHNAMVLSTLIKAWKDLNSVVRVLAIALVRELGVRDPSLIQNIGSLVSRPDYPETHQLAELMNWYLLGDS